MKLELVNSQAGQFKNFENFLITIFPNFVKTTKPVYGMLENDGLYARVPEVHHAGTFPDQSERKAIINRTLMWGTEPAILLFPINMIRNFGVDSWIAYYSESTRKITMPKELVLAWQERETRWRGKPEIHKMLGRWLCALMVHELLHYLNHVALGSVHDLASDHFERAEKATFSEELGWHHREYRIDEAWLQALKIT